MFGSCTTSLAQEFGYNLLTKTVILIQFWEQRHDWISRDQSKSWKKTLKWDLEQDAKV